MFLLGFQQTPHLVVRVPHIPQLKEHNIRPGFFEHEDFLALRVALPDYGQVAASLAYYSDLYRVLHTWKRRCDMKWPACPWICHRGEIRLQSLKHSWRKACEAVGVGQMVKDAKKGRKVWQGKIPHDFRRTAVRNMVLAGVPEKVAMAIPNTRPGASSTGTTS
jgi:hypothetical protein